MAGVHGICKYLLFFQQINMANSHVSEDALLVCRELNSIFYANTLFCFVEPI